MIRGERVILRSMEKTDLPHLHKLRQNVELMTAAQGYWVPKSFEKLLERFDMKFREPDQSWFAIQIDDKVVGDIALQFVDRRSQASAFGMSIVDPDYVGKGYGREALGLFLDWAFDDQNFRRVWLGVWSTNTRAIRAYEACGFKIEGVQREHIFFQGQYVDNIMMGLLRHEWHAHKAKKAKKA
jgi:diamine N-acetyltransferase